MGETPARWLERQSANTPPGIVAVSILARQAIAAVPIFDAPQQYLIPPPPGSLQHPAVMQYRQFVPRGLVTPPPLPPVDWAVISCALITAAKQQPALMILTNYDF